MQGLPLAVQADGDAGFAECRLRDQLAISRALSGTTNLDVSVSVVKANFSPVRSESSSPSRPVLLDVKGAQSVRVYTLLPGSLVTLIPQRLYETTTVSRVTVITPTQLPGRNPAPSVGVDRVLSSVVIPASDLRVLKIEQVTLQSPAPQPSR